MLSVCRIEANKRIDWILRSLAALERATPSLSSRANWRLDLAGKGSAHPPAHRAGRLARHRRPRPLSRLRSRRRTPGPLRSGASLPDAGRAGIRHPSYREPAARNSSPAAPRVRRLRHPARYSLGNRAHAAARPYARCSRVPPSTASSPASHHEVPLPHSAQRRRLGGTGRSALRVGGIDADRPGRLRRLPPL